MENENLAQIIGKNLASLRKAKGLTQQDLAREINYSDKSISKWELGYAIPAVDVLKDFALYYDVTIDYLVKEQTQEDIVKVVEVDKRDIARSNTNKAVVLAMSMMFILLVAFCVFFSDYYFKPNENRLMWNIFFWVVPVCCLVAAFLTHIMYHNKIAVIVLLSAFVWTFLICFGFQMAYFVDPPENVWFLMAVGVPLQVILILAKNYHFKR